VRVAIIAKRLKHKNPVTMTIYVRLDLDPVLESMARTTSAMPTAARTLSG